MRLSNNTAVPEIVELAVFNAAETFDWLTDNGLEVLPEHPVKGVVHDPYSYARYAWGADGGISILEVLEKQLQPHLDSGQVTAKTRSEVTGLIQDEDGAVRGVTVKNEDGSTSEFLGRQTVITSGGYASNPEMFERLEGAVDYSDSSYPYSQGAGLTIGEAAGGYIRGGEHHLPLFGAILGDDNYPSPMPSLTTVEPSLSFEDAQALKDEATTIAQVALTQNAFDIDVKRANNITAAAIYGVSENWLEMRSYFIDAGDEITADDVASLARVAVIGPDIQRDLFDDEDPIGQQIRIGNVPFQVKGVLETRGAGPGGSSLDGIVFIPVTTASKRLFNRDYLTTINLQLKDMSMAARSSTRDSIFLIWPAV